MKLMFILESYKTSHSFFGKFGRKNFPNIELENCEKLIQHYFRDCIYLTNTMFCLSDYLGMPKFMSLVLKFVIIVYKCFHIFRRA